MAINLRIFLICLLTIGILMIFKIISKKHLSIKYGMYWTFIFAFLLILIIFPNIIEWLASICGFKEAPNMLFLISIFIIFYVIFRIYTSISKLNDNNKNVVQELSILKEELRRKNKRKD